MVIEARDNIEQVIWWETKSGTTNIWFDNWTKLGALHYVLPDIPVDESMEDVKDLIGGNEWNVSRLQQLFPADVVEYILEDLELREISDQWDKPWWMMTSTGKFTVSSAWDLLRQRGHVSEDYKNIWLKGLPFKISFCLWRLWKFKLPVDEVLETIGINIVSRCYCCIEPRQEILDHLFLKGDFATTVWNWFSSAAGILMNCCQVKHAVKLWWNAKCHYKLRPIQKAVPAIILWQIWKIRFSSVHNRPPKWPDIIDYFESFTHVIRTPIVKWQLPARGWFKCNTDARHTITDGNNLIAEALAIKKGVDYYISHQLVPLVVETDSLAMKMFISGTWEVPWSITLVVQEINRIRKGHMVNVEHIYREGNGLADFLTNYVFYFATQEL
ncbi:uncharacterized protein LOC132644109 [Lycium barbarum]|uniref:uncharacterized protein LOC132644109 n=1 Tax=Lycium barbarum TaxID=112863 RepID=UPI00293E226E|nr:uncharacterized protein LOC132644109 [Lycium barbarum]